MKLSRTGMKLLAALDLLSAAVKTTTAELQTYNVVAPAQRTVPRAPRVIASQDARADRAPRYIGSIALRA